MKTVKVSLAVLAVLLALLAISTWIHPVVSLAIVAGGVIGSVVACCIGLEREGL